jgi:gamma-glutamyltranspeptidase
VNALKKGLARSRQGMVTSPHPLATEAGLAVLARGGNAIEAALATSAVLAVVAPHFSGLGGDAFWLIADRDGAVQALSGIGQAARQRPLASDTLPLRGPLSASTTAATVDVWDRAHQLSRRAWQGRCSWAELFEPAIAHARQGFAVTASQAFWQELRRTELASWPGFADAYLLQGRVPLAREPMCLPALARSLEQLALRGARDFYEGELAQRIAAGLQAVGSPLTLADLAATRAREESPLSVAYRGGQLLTLRPPTQGVTTLQAMALLDRFDLRAMGEGSADHLHCMVEAIKQAFIERDRHVADPEFADVPVDRMLSSAHLDALAGRIDPARALAWPQPFRHGDTAFLAAVDSAGRGVSALQTIYYDWGSGVVVGDTGILWHNRGAAFSLVPGHPNEWQPGKRPFHTLNPGIYMKNGRPRWLYGTQGADGQPQTLLAVLTRLIDFDLDPFQALARPRFLLGRTFSDSRDSLKIECDVGQGVLDELARRGHEVTALPAQSPLAGQPGVIGVGETGEFQGAHDPRGEGCALGLTA